MSFFQFTSPLMLFVGLSMMISPTVHSKESVVFIHGAHLTAKSWDSVAHSLNLKGYSTRAIDLPGRKDNLPLKKVTLNLSAKSLCNYIYNESGAVTLVAHSQGGAVVNQALSYCSDANIKKIIYVAAVSPLDKEKPFDLLSQSDEDNYFSGIVYDEESSAMVVRDHKAFFSSFSSLRPDNNEKKLMSHWVDEPAKIADGIVTLNLARYREIDKYYIYTKKDKIISLASQKAISKKINLIDSSIIDSGHIPMLTHSDDLTNVLLGFLEPKI